MLLCYLIGLTYVAKQETLGEVRNLWPLLFLGVPLVYALVEVLAGPLQRSCRSPSSSGSASRSGSCAAASRATCRARS